jgi:hypothetical protein
MSGLHSRALRGSCTFRRQGRALGCGSALLAFRLWSSGLAQAVHRARPMRINSHARRRFDYQTQDRNSEAGGATYPAARQRPPVLPRLGRAPTTRRATTTLPEAGTQLSLSEEPATLYKHRVGSGHRKKSLTSSPNPTNLSGRSGM